MSGKYATVTSTLKYIKREEGVRSLWKGTQSAIMRQFVFAGLKLAIYEPFKLNLCKTEEEKIATPMHKKVIAGVVSGGIASYFSSPFDLVKIRMQDSKKSRGYNGTIDCFRQIYKNDGGIRGYFKGVGPNVSRNSFMNAAELVAFDTTRQMVQTKTNLPDHPALYLFYGAMAGLVGTLL